MFGTNWTEKAKKLKAEQKAAWDAYRYCKGSDQEKAKLKKEYEKIANAYDKALGKVIAQKVKKREKEK